jgi:hypothetical protein
MLLVSILLIHILSAVSASISRERTELTWHSSAVWRQATLAAQDEFAMHFANSSLTITSW